MHRLFSIAVLVLLLLSSTGCVRRRLTVRSNPPGALVMVDKQPIGVTPVSTKFIYYGTRNIDVVQEGYEAEEIRQHFSPPWYQWPLIDFVAETLIPYEFRDERFVDVNLQPKQAVPAQEIVERAEQLRSNTTQGIATPLPDAP